MAALIPSDGTGTGKQLLGDGMRGAAGAGVVKSGKRPRGKWKVESAISVFYLFSSKAFPNEISGNRP